MVFIYTMALRIDKLKLDSHRLDHDGYLHADNALATRAGILVYHHADGSVTRELRHPDEVFKEDSASTLIQRPIVDNHPMSGKVTPDNIKHLSIGTCGNKTERTDDDYLKISLLINDAAAISKITKKEKVELSCGYHADVVEESGEYNGERYDHVQKNIIYNHLALVNKGRAGEKARVYLDSEDAASDDFDIEPQTQLKFDNEKVKIMKIKRNAIKTKGFKIDAATIEIADESESAVQTILDQLDDAAVVINDLETLTSKLESEKSALQGKCDQLEEDKSKGIDPEKLDALASERADVCGVATHLGMKDFAKLDSAAIKHAIVLKANEGLTLDGKDESYVNARYDSVVDQIKRDNKGLESLANLNKVTTKIVTDGDRTKGQHLDGDEKSPRQNYLDSVKNLHEKSADQAA